MDHALILLNRANPYGCNFREGQRVRHKDAGQRRDGRPPFARTSRLGPFQFKFPHRSLEIKNQMPDRSFPPPWSVEEHSGYLVVRDHRGQGLAYIYYENELRPAISRKLLTKDEARRIAANVAKLPELVQKP